MDTYALAVLPSKDVSDIVDSYRREFAKFTDYVIVPHITLIPPFYIKSGVESEIIVLLNNIYKNIQLFSVLINKINYFEGKNNVAFFQPDSKSSKNIKTLVIKAVGVLNDRIRNAYDDYPFTTEEFIPHMTIAEKIPVKNLNEIKMALSGVIPNFSFQVSSLHLFKQSVASNEWKELSEIRF